MLFDSMGLSLDEMLKWSDQLDGIGIAMSFGLGLGVDHS